MSLTVSHFALGFARHAFFLETDATKPCIRSCRTACILGIYLISDMSRPSAKSPGYILKCLVVLHVFSFDVSDEVSRPDSLPWAACLYPFETNTSFNHIMASH